MARKHIGSWADESVFIPDENKVDQKRSEVLAQIRKAKHRPASDWREKLYSKPFQPVQVEVR